MPRCIPLLAAFVIGWAGSAGVLHAQTNVRTPAAPIGVQASNAGGRIQGIVRDQAGQGIGGVSIIALGSAVAAATSDRAGHFSLALAPGEYVLRATRDGYISTYREVVSVHLAARLERNITLVRAAEARPVFIASITGQAGMAPVLVVDPAAHSHSDTAWRLRHLPRSALRDTTFSSLTENDEATAPGRDVLGRASFARAATSYFTNTDFSGQVNFVTTSTVAASSWLPNEMPRGVAYVAVGAPIAGHGDWRVRGAVTAGDLSSWTLLGEYDTHPAESHAFHVGVSYSTQGYTGPDSSAAVAVAAQSRSVGSLYGFDRWRLNSRLAIDYGLRLDHFDYVAQTTFLSPRIGARVDLLPRTSLVTFASQRTVAPGADEFLPPSSPGLWLPAERTFTTIVPGAPMRAERVRHYEVGVEHAFGDESASPRVGIRRFLQQTENQIATLFGFDETAGVGNYYVASPGDVEVSGWAVRASGTLAAWMGAMVEYSWSDANWSNRYSARMLRGIAPSAARRDGERLHDLTTTFGAVVPEINTRLTFAYRLGNAFGATSARGSSPITDGRFDVEIRQPLPFQPIGGRLEMLFAMRNLMRDPRDIVSIYDELLTVAPPMRMMGGLQVKF